VVVELIGATTTRQGLRVHAERDTGLYPKDVMSRMRRCRRSTSKHTPGTANGTTPFVPDRSCRLGPVHKRYCPESPLRGSAHPQDRLRADPGRGSGQAHRAAGALSIGKTRDTRGRTPTLRTYLSDWLARREGKVGARTLLRYRKLIATHVEVDPISQMQVTKLSAGDVDHMLARRLATGIAPRTAFHIRAVLRTALNAAIPQLIATNPEPRPRTCRTRRC